MNDEKRKIYEETGEYDEKNEIIDIDNTYNYYREIILY